MIEESPEKKAFYKRTYILISVFGLLSISGLIYDVYLTHKENNEQECNLIKTNITISKGNHVMDSLTKVNYGLSKFKTLTMAMIRRDEITNQLNHKVGDIVYMKNDSSKVVIEDVLIGGNKYNYYIKFKVLYKDNTTRDVIPELIYNK